ncbi:hypothetical protein QE152_g6554 [Popillia japonica]|uniref:Uncharacterized protein n=1 Tax=Popillia japonica TaxID=7064 RepID=A0AAW1MEB3_POPJA
MKSYYHRKWRSTGLLAYRKDLAELRQVCKREIASAYSAYLGTIQNSLKTNPKALWSYVESQKGTSRIPGRMRHGDQELDNPRDTVNSFAEEFARAYSGPCNSVSPLLSSDLLSFHIPLISYDTTVKLMATLSNKYTSGDDQLPSFFIKDVRYALANPLQIIINLAISNCTFPDLWKRSRIVPGSVEAFENCTSIQERRQNFCI